MINTIVSALSDAFYNVVTLVGEIFGTGEEGGIFGAIEQLSSGIFN